MKMVKIDCIDPNGYYLLASVNQFRLWNSARPGGVCQGTRSCVAEEANPRFVER